MKDPKVVGITLDERSINIELDVRDEDLVSTVLDSLTEYVAKGSPLKIMQTHAASMSESKRIFTKVISRQSQMNEWKNELKQLMCVMQQESCV